MVTALKQFIPGASGIRPVHANQHAFIRDSLIGIPGLRGGHYLVSEFAKAEHSEPGKILIRIKARHLIQAFSFSWISPSISVRCERT
jgi:hypothetical protein